MGKSLNDKKISQSKLNAVAVFFFFFFERDEVNLSVNEKKILYAPQKHLEFI